MRQGLAWLFTDLRLGLRRGREAVLVTGFFVLMVVLFPLGLGPDPQRLREVAPGIFWAAALLAVVLAAPGLFEEDHREGVLEQWLLSSLPLPWLVALRILSHWLIKLGPLVLISPLLGLQFGLPTPALWAVVFSLLLGTPLLLLIGAVGSALTLGLRNAGLLTGLLILPLMLPVLILGSASVSAALVGTATSPWLSVLGGLLILAVMAVPFAVAAALRVMLD